MQLTTALAALTGLLTAAAMTSAMVLTASDVSVSVRSTLCKRPDNELTRISTGRR